MEWSEKCPVNLRLHWANYLGLFTRLCFVFRKSFTRYSGDYFRGTHSLFLIKTIRLQWKVNICVGLFFFFLRLSVHYAINPVILLLSEELPLRSQSRNLSCLFSCTK